MITHYFAPQNITIFTRVKGRRRKTLNTNKSNVIARSKEKLDTGTSTLQHLYISRKSWRIRDVGGLASECTKSRRTPVMTLLAFAAFVRGYHYHICRHRFSRISWHKPLTYISYYLSACLWSLNRTRHTDRQTVTPEASVWGASIVWLSCCLTCPSVVTGYGLCLSWRHFFIQRIVATDEWEAVRRLRNVNCSSETTKLGL